MITLYGGGAGFGLPEVSPYVTKTEVQLKMAGLAYRKELAHPQAAPKGQLPFIDDDGEVVADSTFIRAHIERKHGIDFDRGLDDVQRAQAWAIERMVENHFGWACAHARWMLPENFEKGPGRWFDGAPAEMRAQLKADVLERVSENLRTVGIGRHAPQDITMLGRRSLEALSALLGDKPYLLGAEPCGVDATAFGALAGLLTPYFDSPLRREAEGFRNLVAYVARMMREHYPAHPWEAAGR